MRIEGSNGHNTNLYTVTTLTQGSSQVDLQPNASFGFTVNPEALDAVENELSTFSGVSWQVFEDPAQIRSKYIDVSASPVSAGTHNYSPAGWVGTDAEVIIVAGTGALPSITGLAGGADGRRATFLNGGSIAISLPNQDTNSDANKRFILPGLGALNLPVGGAANFMYQAGSVNRWRSLD